MQGTTFILLACVALSECEMEPFVVGGGRADIHDFPYIAYLGIKCSQDDDDGELYFCGSSIINQRITLTAAHCLFYCTENSSITVAVGNAHINGGVLSTARSFLIHEHYSQQTVDNDIALVLVTTAFIFSDSVSRVALMPRPPHNELARLAGWGLRDEQKEKSTSNLLYTEQKVVELPQCEVLLNKIPNGTFCGSSTTLRGYASM
ncbi:unnamed protein product [Arctia plantaginis]|uniref:Peptidase S1 domain-containing protein n=1 Tax=Arctia plantaginis TaxID=874455 RepID=A0A8S1AUQ2_ARCPL|nr:unnamed protein product [Arctia plantaginis]